MVPPLTASDTFVAPEKFSSQLLGIVSPWIDLCSSDPAVYHVSRQVLQAEIAFASFCGINVLTLPIPSSTNRLKSSQGISLYANAIKESLDSFPYMNFAVSLPMMDAPSESTVADDSLSHLARPEYVDSSHHILGSSTASTDNVTLEERLASKDQDTGSQDDSRPSLDSSRKRVRINDFLGSWDVWNTIRTVGKYSARLSVSE